MVHTTFVDASDTTPFPVPLFPGIRHERFQHGPLAGVVRRRRSLGETPRPGHSDLRRSCPTRAEVIIQRIVEILKDAKAAVSVKDLRRSASRARSSRDEARYGRASTSDVKRLQELASETGSWCSTGKVAQRGGAGPWQANNNFKSWVRQSVG